MTTSAKSDPHVEVDRNPKTKMASIRRVVQLRLIRELLIILVFFLLTSLMTWPYVTRLRDAVAGPGDPYLVSWMLWWDYHQTFTDPLNLFQSNTFYPYRYTLAFSETCYGVALPFFPLFALGARPLTVHAVAMFFGFVLSGYAAFRLTRTLTGSNGAAWVAGILFAFIPYRFNLLAQLMYEFSIWLPLIFEAQILFVRERSWKRAAWLGFVFFMTGLASVSWLLMSLIPLAIIGAILLTRHGIWNDRSFWQRSAVALSVACVALLPFTVPFYIVSKMYGFKRRVEDVKAHSALPIHWFVAEGRSKLWHGMGESITGAWKFQMFPGLLPLLFPFAEFFRRRSTATDRSSAELPATQFRWLHFLDAVILISLVVSILAIGYDETDYFGGLFHYHLKSERLLGLFTLAAIVRLCIAYPTFLRRENTNLIDTIRSKRRDDAFWVGVVLLVIGFFYSIGWNFFFYRLLYYYMPGFQSMRAPMRGAMFAYLGLAILSGLGVSHLAVILPQRRAWFTGTIVFSLACLLLLLEMNNAPLYFIRGDVYPDQVTQRLKQTTMRGGIMYFPEGPDYNQRYMLRAADHGKPLIIGTSGFMPPNNLELERMLKGGNIPNELIDLLEKIPTSYLVVANELIREDRKQDFQVFLGRMIQADRLRFINRFDGQHDLYAVTKNEPEARAEAGLPFDLSIHDWAGTIHNDPVAMLGGTLAWTQKLYRIYVASTGAMPRYKEFVTDFDEISRGVIVGAEDESQLFANHFSQFLNSWTKRERFEKTFGHLDDAGFVDKLIENAGLTFDPVARQALVAGLTNHQESRASVLSKIADDPGFIEKEQYRSLIDLHYFAYLRRNPDDPPDGDLRGFNFWLDDLERNHTPAKLASAFSLTDEYRQFQKK